MNDIAFTATAAAVLLLALYLVKRGAAQQYDPQNDIGPMDEGWGAWTDPAMVDAVPVEGDSQTAGFLESTFVAFTPSTYTGTGTDPSSEDANVRAFLNMLAYAEGTDGPDGYRTMFGGALFDSFADHPRKFFTFTNSKGESLKTSAAGRYQFLARTWDELRAKLGLQDFGPASQDAGAIELIRQRGALNDVKAGRVVDAISKVRSVWASLPGAGYSQPERTIPKLLAAYQASGGAVLTA
jgi:lysozyme